MTTHTPPTAAALFTPTRAGAIALANRIVMAPLTRNRAPNAMPHGLMQTYYVQRATAGLIITEATAISHQGQGYADVPGLWSAEQVAAWRLITDAVHAAGGGAPVAPSAIRAKAKTVLIRDGVPGFEETSQPRALAPSELPGIVEDYRIAAKNAIAAGFDGVEIHAANGYLLDQFMKSGANERTDAYGGSLENRARLMLEVMRAVCAEIGADRTAIRLSPVTPANGIDEPQPQPLFDYVASQLGAMEGGMQGGMQGGLEGAIHHRLDGEQWLRRSHGAERCTCAGRFGRARSSVYCQPRFGRQNCCWRTVADD